MALEGVILLTTNGSNKTSILFGERPEISFTHLNHQQPDPTLGSVSHPCEFESLFYHLKIVGRTIPLKTNDLVEWLHYDISFCNSETVGVSIALKRVSEYKLLEWEVAHRSTLHSCGSESSITHLEVTGSPAKKNITIIPEHLWDAASEITESSNGANKQRRPRELQKDTDSWIVIEITVQKCRTH